MKNPKIYMGDLGYWKSKKSWEREKNWLNTFQSGEVKIERNDDGLITLNIWVDEIKK